MFVSGEFEKPVDLKEGKARQQHDADTAFGEAHFDVTALLRVNHHSAKGRVSGGAKNCLQGAIGGTSKFLFTAQMQ